MTTQVSASAPAVYPDWGYEEDFGTKMILTTLGNVGNWIIRNARQFETPTNPEGRVVTILTGTKQLTNIPIDTLKEWPSADRAITRLRWTHSLNFGPPPSHRDC